MKLVKDIKLEREVIERLWNTAHERMDDEGEAYYQGALVALEWVLDKYEDKFIPLYDGLLEH